MPKMVIHSDYLKGKENVFEGDIITFLDAGVYGPSERDADRMQWLFWVKLPNREKKKCTPNKTSCQTLKDAWGEMTENWVNQQAKIRVSYENVFGEMKNVIYLEPAEGVATVKTAVPEPSKVGPLRTAAKPAGTGQIGSAFDPNTGEPLPGAQEIS